MKKPLLLAVTAVLSIQLHAQDSTGTAEKKQVYFATASELIFSWGDVEAKPLEPSPIVRFSCFLHLEEQLNYDFSDKVGFYTGVSLRNVGFINDLNDTVKLKQRVYTLGIPVALKIGNMDGTSLRVGAEGELALNYKQKVYVNGEKTKTNIWFSDRTNLFLPSVFAEIKFSQGLYLKFKYYLTDFLVEDKQKINVAGVVYVPTKSQLMYAAIGVVLKDKKYKK
ncbi:MAG: hypothetical protein ABI723_03055 [Bacteroidia bacterium]